MDSTSLALARAFAFGLLLSVPTVLAEAPPSPHRQLPKAMHGSMSERASISVGTPGSSATLSGTDNVALQAAVDYVAALGGGTVEIRAGTFLMRDSLHLRPHVTVRGQGDATVLRKAPAAVSPLALDGDFGEEQVTIAKADGFRVGDGIAVWDKRAGGFHTTVGRITGRNGNTFSVSRPLMADCMVENDAMAASVFPVVSGYDAEGARIENLTIEGSKADNIHLNGCRGAGIFLYRSHGAVISGCVVRGYNGDGISFQQSNDVQVTGCIAEDNASLGLHPGSGSQRPQVKNNIARRNGEDGLFLCWRVKEGVFSGNTLEANGRFGISIGHKDTDNLLQDNRVLANAHDGIFFRNESEGMAGHRNRIENNVIENNGTKEPSAGIRVRGETRDLVLRNNTIRDTRSGADRRQTTGIRIEEKAGPITTEANRIEADVAIDDRRPKT
ncbi:MAG: right-handed parallel beta-helix repeat-containing protein [Verrucomicrobiales bacterium]|nr:right-handed parallel beta-helix repeat-containing protein [Verrucomicrobiales bacterium]